MGKVVALILIGVLALLGTVEVRRYLASRSSDEEMPYPRRRLSRRLAIAGLFIASVASVGFWPRLSPWVDLGVFIAVAWMVLIGLVLLWRDLRETSLAVVEHSARLNKEAGREIDGLLHEQTHDARTRKHKA